MSHITRRPVFGFPTRSDTNWAVQQQSEISDLGRRETVLASLCSKNGGADQLRSYCAADLCMPLKAFAKTDSLMTRHKCH